MPFASTWIDLEIIILSKISQTREIQISYDITYVWNLKNDTNELIYKTEMDSQTQKTNLWLPKEKEASQVGLVVKNPPAKAGDNKRCGFDPWIRKIPWRRAW